MFSIRNESFAPFEKYILQNQLTGEYVSIIPDFGGNVNELMLKKENKLYSILDGNETAKELINDTIYKGAHLIPFSGRIIDGVYTFHSKTYQLPVNETDRNNALHGFLNDKKLNVLHVSNDNESASLELSYDYKRNVPGYPFTFRLSLIYTLSAGGLKINISVKNTGTESMPFSCGWHPYFRFNEPVDNLYFQIPATDIVELTEHLVPSGELVATHQFTRSEKIGSAQLDTCFVMKNEKIVRARLYSPTEDYSLCLWQQAGERQFRYMQVYIPPHRRSIAIEPVSAPPNVFNNRMAPATLAPAETFEASYGVNIE